MTTEFPTAHEYSSETARHPSLVVVDIRRAESDIHVPYANQVLLEVNADCMRMAVFEGEYRWHSHPDSDELFLVVSGELQIEFELGAMATLTAWQCLVVPAGTVHRTRAIGRTVNLTYEKRGATTVFVDPPAALAPGDCFAGMQEGS